MPGLVPRLLDRGFGHPAGLLGRIGGRLMARGNAATEHRLVELADPGPTDVVLVVGPGPGVGLRAAALRAERAIAVDPSDVMLDACRRRCANLVKTGAVDLVRGEAARTNQPAASIDVALSVNNVQLWPDRGSGFAELIRVLRPGGRLFVSVHDKWLPGGLDGLGRTVAAAGFDDVRTWRWEPPGRAAGTAAQLSAVRPA
jgi:arsenite methyltransferase